MTPEEFIKKVVCPLCQTKIDQKPPFQSNSLVCNCRLSKQIIIKRSHNNPHTSYTFKLSLNKEMMMVVKIYDGEDILPPTHFYVAHEDRPFFPLYELKEIPDYIFLPLKDLIAKLELYATFS